MSTHLASDTLPDPSTIINRQSLYLRLSQLAPVDFKSLYAFGFGSGFCSINSDPKVPRCWHPSHDLLARLLRVFLLQETPCGHDIPDRLLANMWAWSYRS
jgi:hypothetical protein